MSNTAFPFSFLLFSSNKYPPCRSGAPRWGLALKSVDIIKNYVNTFKAFALALLPMGAPSSVRCIAGNVSRLAGADSIGCRRLSAGLVFPDCRRRLLRLNSGGNR